jgi:hypothetical protein
MWPAPAVRSVWQRPVAVIRTRISVGRGSPSSISWTVKGAPGSSMTAAAESGVHISATEHSGDAGTLSIGPAASVDSGRPEVRR